MMTRAEFAKQQQTKGANCAQSIALAYQDLVPVSPKHLFQAAEGFGGGMGQMQETCGLLTGLYMIIGLLFSDGNLEKGQTKLQTYEKIRALHDAFKAELGATHCLDLLDGQKPSFKACHDPNKKDKFMTACKVFEEVLAKNGTAVPQAPDFLK